MRAPEICYFERFKKSYDGEKADVFALAYVLFVFHYKKLPVNNNFKYVIDNPTYKDFCKENYERIFIKENEEDDASNDFKNLFIGMFQKDPKLRFSLEQILESKWLKAS